MKKHTDAVKTAIQQIPAVASKTWVSVAPRDSQGKLPAPPYVVIHPQAGTDKQDRVTGPKKSQYPRFTLHMVGSSYDNAASVAELVKAKFVVAGVGVKLAITGETTKPCWWSQPLPTQVDDSVAPPLVYEVAELGFQSDIA